MKKYLKPLKIKESGKNVFFWGCLHLNHDPKWENPIWKMRGFNSVHEYNEAAKNAWCAKLNEESIIFLLGDTCFGHDAENFLMKFFQDVPFKDCYMLPGNHTAGWKSILEKTNEDGELKIENGEKGKKIILVPNYLEVIVEGHPIVCSHYPIASWNGQGKGSFMLHAHVHKTLEKSEIGKILYKSRIKEVSFENERSPASFEQIKKDLNKSVITFDHHGKDTKNPF